MIYAADGPQPRLVPGRRPASLSVLYLQPATGGRVYFCKESLRAQSTASAAFHHPSLLVDYRRLSGLSTDHPSSSTVPSSNPSPRSDSRPTTKRERRAEKPKRESTLADPSSKSMISINLCGHNNQFPPLSQHAACRSNTSNNDDQKGGLLGGALSQICCKPLGHFQLSVSSISSPPPTAAAIRSSDRCAACSAPP